MLRLIVDLVKKKKCLKGKKEGRKEGRKEEMKDGQNEEGKEGGESKEERGREKERKSWKEKAYYEDSQNCLFFFFSIFMCVEYTRVHVCLHIAGTHV